MVSLLMAFKIPAVDDVRCSKLDGRQIEQYIAAEAAIHVHAR